MRGKLLSLAELSEMALLVADCEFVTAFGATALKDIAAGFGRHSQTEPVIVFALAVRWLKCSFHITLNKKLISNSNQTPNIGINRR